MTDVTLALTVRIAAIKADIENDRNITQAGIALRIEQDTELLQLMRGLRGHRCQFCKPASGVEDARLSYFRKGRANVGANILMVCDEHERMIWHRSAQVLAHTDDTLKIRLEDGVHMVSTALQPRENAALSPPT